MFVPISCSFHALISRLDTAEFSDFWLLIISIFFYLSRRRRFIRMNDENREWRRLHNEELRSLYRSPNIVRMIKSRRLISVDHVARMEEDGSALNILTGKPT